MGVVADAVLETGGTVLGVIPEFLTQWEVAHENVTQLVVTDSMHSRKRHLYEESDAFLVMPGGLGTFDEAFEIITSAHDDQPRIGYRRAHGRPALDQRIVSLVPFVGGHPSDDQG